MVQIFCCVRVYSSRFYRRTAVLCGFWASYETQRTAMDIGIM
jgi:hypothetical protein